MTFTLKCSEFNKKLFKVNEDFQSVANYYASFNVRVDTIKNKGEIVITMIDAPWKEVV